MGQSKSWRQNAGGPPNFKAFLRMPNGGGFVDFRKSPNLRYKIPVLQMRGCLPKKKNTTPSVGPRKLPRDPQGFAELPGASGTSEVLPRAAVSRMGTAFFFNETFVNPLQPSL